MFALTTSTGDLVVLIASLTAAGVSLITAWNTTRVRGEVREVRHEVKTMNESTLGQLGAEAETRRIDHIAVRDRTPKESRHMEGDH